MVEGVSGISSFVGYKVSGWIAQVEGDTAPSSIDLGTTVTRSILGTLAVLNHNLYKNDTFWQLRFDDVILSSVKDKKDTMFYRICIPCRSLPLNVKAICW